MKNKSCNYKSELPLYDRVSCVLSSVSGGGRRKGKEAQACGHTQRLDGDLACLPLCQKWPFPWCMAPQPSPPPTSCGQFCTHPAPSRVAPSRAVGAEQVGRSQAQLKCACTHESHPSLKAESGPSESHQPGSFSSLRGPASHSPYALLSC